MADDNNKVIIEIVLDDGSIQKGFARFTDEAKKAADNSKKELKTIGDVLNTDLVGGLKSAVLDIPLKFAAIGIAAVAAGAIIKEAFDLTLEGERIKSVEVQFNSFTEAAGVSSETLREGLEKAANGLIDTTDLMKIATGATIALGASVERLPEVLEISRKATIALGGSLEERFEAATRAIETGNTGLLRSQGIIIDQEKAFKKYADSLGLASSELTKANEQQAILNAFIEQAGTKFADATGGVTRNNAAVKQLSVLMTELRESFAKFVESNFGQIFANLASDLKGALDALTKKDGIQKATTDAADLRVQIINTTNQIANLKNENDKLSDSFLDGFAKDRNQISILKLEEKLAGLESRFKSVATAATTAANAGGGAETETPDGAAAAQAVKLTELQVAAIAKRNNEIQALNLQAVSDEIAKNEALIAATTDYGAKQDLINQTRIDKELLLEEQHQLNLAQIEAKYVGNEKATLDRKNAEIYTATLSFNAKLSKAKADALTQDEARRKADLANLQGTLGYISTLMSSSSRELFEIGKVAAISNATINGFTAVSNALAVPPPPLGFALAALAAVAAAANVASIVGTQFGGGGSISAPSLSAPSAGSSPAVDIPGFGKPADIERAPKEGLVVNINGDILGDDNSGKRLVDLMNSAFDTAGVSLRQGIV